MNGEFVTASKAGNNIVFWPQPLKDSGVMTKNNGTMELYEGKIFRFILKRSIFSDI